MKFKTTLDEITLRGVTFEKGKAVTVDDEAFAVKLRGLDYFQEVKRGRKAKPDDENSD